MSLIKHFLLILTINSSVAIIAAAQSDKTQAAQKVQFGFGRHCINAKTQADEIDGKNVSIHPTASLEEIRQLAATTYNIDKNTLSLHIYPLKPLDKEQCAHAIAIDLKTAHEAIMTGKCILVMQD